MLFFSGGLIRSDKRIKKKAARDCCGAAVLKDKSLQVPPPGAKTGARFCLKKRVLPFISRKFPASLSVEAAIAVPMFLFFSLALLSPIRWLDEQRTLLTESERICEEISLWAYGGDERADDMEDTVVYEESYVEEIPFFSGVFPGIRMNIAAQRRKWIGLDGKLRCGDGVMGESELTGEMVYVGAGMGRYHLRRDCHYISNQYESVTVEEAKNG